MSMTTMHSTQDDAMLYASLAVAYARKLNLSTAQLKDRVNAPRTQDLLRAPDINQIVAKALREHAAGRV